LEERTMNLPHERAARLLVETIDILCDDRGASRLRQTHDRMMRWIGFRSGNWLDDRQKKLDQLCRLDGRAFSQAPPSRELVSWEISPKSSLIPESWDAALG